MLKKKTKTHKHKKKKISPFYKITFSLIVISSIILFYFVVLVSLKPQSFPFVSRKIEAKIVEEFGAGSTIADSKISFTAYGSLRVSVIGLNISYNQTDLGREFFSIPRLETELSLLNILFFNFHPTKIKIINPTIVVKDIDNLKSPKQQNLAEESQLQVVAAFLATIREGENPIENFEVEDANFIIFNGDLRTDILLKKSKIELSNKDQGLRIFSQNQISFDKEKNDVNLDADCQIADSYQLRCDLSLNNFAPDSLSNLNFHLFDLAKISANFDANLSFEIKEGELGNVAFKAKSDMGNFDFPEFFSQKIDFKNLTIAGEYDGKLKILSLSAIESDFVNKSDETILTQQNGHLSMSATFSKIDEKQSRSQLYIRLQDIATDDLKKFWPVSLDQSSIRSWVIDHMQGGIIKSAHAKFSLLNNGDESFLEDIDSQVVISGVNLNYESSFPTISGISAIARFDKESMKIRVLEGDVLQSKISEGLVEIDDFSAPKVILKISGNLKGQSSDGFGHVNEDPKFLKEVARYLNGHAMSKFDVRLNLSDEITLKRSYISIESTLMNLDNQYVKGRAVVKSKKNFGSNNFITKIDLSATEILAKEFDVIKKSGQSSGFDFIVWVSPDGKKVAIKNILLTSKNKKSKISGNLEINTSLALLTKLYLKNENFGRNNFSLYFAEDEKTGFKTLSLKGSQLNLATLISNKSFDKIGSDSVKKGFKYNFKISAYLNRIELLNGKVLRNFSLAVNCVKGLCDSGLVKTNYFGKNFIDIKVSKEPKEDFSKVSGEISELGYLFDGFGISNVISGGNAKLEITNKAEKGKAIFEGEIKDDEDITIYETAAVKKLSKDDLFSKVKDKIFSSEKTTFSSVKIKFDCKDHVLNIQSLIANNYKIGVTAKGTINVRDSVYNLKGMIIPGFLINNLFGIGNIPLIGGVISGILTGGEEGGGVFGLKYEYVKNKGDKEGKFTTNKVSSFVPSTIQNLLDF